MKILKMIGITLASILLLLILVTLVTLSVAPQFGKSYNSHKALEFSDLENYNEEQVRIPTGKMVDRFFMITHSNYALY